MFDSSKVSNKYFICHVCRDDKYIIDELEIPDDHKFYDRPKFKTLDELKMHKKTDEHKECLRDIFCVDCNHQCMSIGDFDEHLESKEHLKNSRFKELKCEMCNYEAKTIALMEQHKKTQRHKDNEDGVEHETFHCEACDLHFQFKSKYDQHMITKKHQDKANGIEKTDVFECIACQYITKYKHHYQQHCATTKHQSKIVNSK